MEEGGVAPLFAQRDGRHRQWQTDQRPDAIISILDSRNYPLPASITLRNEGSLAIEAASRERPLLQTPAAGTDARRHCLRSRRATPIATAA